MILTFYTFCSNKKPEADDALTITAIIQGGGKNIDQKRDYITPPAKIVGKHSGLMI